MITLLTREDKKRLEPLPCEVQLAGREEGAPLSKEHRRCVRAVKRQHAGKAPPPSHRTHCSVPTPVQPCIWPLLVCGPAGIWTLDKGVAVALLGPHLYYFIV